MDANKLKDLARLRELNKLLVHGNRQQYQRLREANETINFMEKVANTQKRVLDFQCDELEKKDDEIKLLRERKAELEKNDKERQAKWEEMEADLATRAMRIQELQEAVAEKETEMTSVVSDLKNENAQLSKEKKELQQKLKRQTVTRNSTGPVKTESASMPALVANNLSLPSENNGGNVEHNVPPRVKTENGILPPSPDEQSVVGALERKKRDRKKKVSVSVGSQRVTRGKLNCQNKRASRVVPYPVVVKTENDEIDRKLRRSGRFSNMLVKTEGVADIDDKKPDWQKARTVGRYQQRSKELECFLCKKVFGSGSALSAHVFGCHGPRSYKEKYGWCTHCGTMFSTLNQLKTHSKYHSNL